MKYKIAAIVAPSNERNKLHCAEQTHKIHSFSNKNF